jgi:hypothetical protein
MVSLEGPDEHITLARAAEISGLSPATLRKQARARKLRTVRSRREWLTTRRWLHEYLLAATRRDKGARKPLPEGYISPELCL